MGKIIRNGVEYPSGGGRGGGGSWITDIPEMHRNIFRGKNLGTAVTAAQLAAIADGSFDDLYIGDYWTIPVTINNVSTNVIWRIADFDYWLNVGWENAGQGLYPLEEHHAVIVPDTILYSHQYHSSVSIAQYVNSTMHTAGMMDALAMANEAFPDMVLSYFRFSVNSGGNNKTAYQSTVDLMSEIMITGEGIHEPVYSRWTGTSERYQLALFRLAPSYINTPNQDMYWLSTISSSSYPVAIVYGVPYSENATEVLGVRPCFVIGTET